MKQEAHRSGLPLPAQPLAGHMASLQIIDFTKYLPRSGITGSYGNSEDYKIKIHYFSLKLFYF